MLHLFTCTSPFTEILVWFKSFFHVNVIQMQLEYEHCRWICTYKWELHALVWLLRKFVKQLFFSHWVLLLVLLTIIIISIALTGKNIKMNYLCKSLSGWCVIVVLVCNVYTSNYNTSISIAKTSITLILFSQKNNWVKLTCLGVSRSFVAIEHA